MDEIKVLEQFMHDRKIKIFSLEIDMRFAKRLITTAGNDEAIRLQNQLSQWEKMLEGEKKYLELLKEIYEEKSTKIARA